jgi:hypothetical protein
LSPCAFCLSSPCAFFVIPRLVRGISNKHNQRSRNESGMTVCTIRDPAFCLSSPGLSGGSLACTIRDPAFCLSSPGLSGGSLTYTIRDPGTSPG